MKFIKTLPIFLMIFMMLFSFVSCNNEAETPKPVTGSVTLVTVREKGLIASSDAKIVKYLYNAEPLFEHPYLTGKTGGFVMLGTGEVNSIGQLSQGEWKLSVKALNSSGNVLAKGEAQLFILAGQENTVNIKLYTDETSGNGKVAISVDTYKVSEDGASAVIKYNKVSENKEGTIVQVTPSKSVQPDGKITYTALINNLSAGFYDFTVTILDKGYFIAGEQAVVQVVANETATLKGSLTPVSEAAFTISVDTPLYIDGKIETNSKEQVYEGKNLESRLELNTDYVYTWKNTENSTITPNYFIWALDGVIDETNRSSSYTYRSAEYGEHRLSVLGIHKEGDKEVELGSATAHILIPRRTANVIFRGNGGTFADGSQQMIIYQDAISDPILPGGGKTYDGINPTRPGYYLSGWVTLSGQDAVTITKNSNGTFSTVIKEPFACDGELKLDARWTKDLYNMEINWGPNVYVDGNLKPEKEIVKSITYDTALSSYLRTPSRYGFKFEGFFTEPDGRGNKVEQSSLFDGAIHSTLYAYWSYIPLKVNLWYLESDYNSYKAGNSITPYRQLTVGTGLKYASLPQPNRQGYVFKGWFSEEGGEVVSSTEVTKKADHSLIAKWADGAVPVKFDLVWDSPTSAVQSEMAGFSDKKGALGSRYGALPFDGKSSTSIRPYYEFLGWYDTSTYSMRIYNDSVCTTNNEHTLYAKWRGAEFTITFDEKGTTKAVRYLEPYGELPEIGKFGFEFLGWYTQPVAGGTRITSDMTVTATGNHTLYPHWRRLYSPISFDTDGGTISNGTSLYVFYEDTYAHALNSAFSTSKLKTVNGNTYKDCHEIIVSGNWNSNPASASYAVYDYTVYGLPTCSKTGYTFKGWRSDVSNTNSIVSGASVNNSIDPQKLYATFTPNTYTLSLYSDGSLFTSKQIVFNDRYGTLPTPKKTGHNFSGYYLKSDFSGDRLLSTSTVTTASNHSAYAKWTVKTLLISFNSNGGSVVEPVSRQWNQSYGTLPVPTYYGYTFAGWSEPFMNGAETEYRKIGSADRVTKEIDYTLKANWTAKPVTYNLNPNGGTVNGSGDIITRTAYFAGAYRSLTNSTIADLPDPVKTGYNFTGWYDENGVKIESADVIKREDTHTLSAGWTPKAVQVLYHPNTCGLSGMGETSQTVYYDGTLGECGTQYVYEGYMIDEWYYDEAMTKRAYSTDVIKTTEPIHIYPKWFPVSTVYFYDTADDSHSYISASELINKILGFTGNNDGYHTCYINIGGTQYDTARIGNDWWNLSLYSNGSATSGSFTAPRTQTINIIIEYTNEVFKHLEGCNSSVTCSTCGGDGEESYTYEDCPGHTTTTREYCDGCTTSGNNEICYGHETTTTEYCSGCTTYTSTCTCSTCSGSGSLTCSTCKGTGYLTKSVIKKPSLTLTKNGSVLSPSSSEASGGTLTEHTCPVCGGNKSIYQNGVSVSCANCGGAGTVNLSYTSWSLTLNVNKGDVIAYNISVPSGSSYTYKKYNYSNVSDTETNISNFTDTEKSSYRTSSITDQENEFTPYKRYVFSSGLWSMVKHYITLISSDGARLSLSDYDDRKFDTCTLSNGSFSYNDLVWYWHYPGFIYRQKHLNGRIISSTQETIGVVDVPAGSLFKVNNASVANPTLIWGEIQVQYDTGGAAWTRENFVTGFNVKIVQ